MWACVCGGAGGNRYGGVLGRLVIASDSIGSVLALADFGQFYSIQQWGNEDWGGGVR